MAEQPVFSEQQTARGLELFKKHVRVVLAHHCVECHGGEATESEFDMTTRPALLKGGANGPAILPGRASASRLVKLITHEMEPKMPEEADKLPPEAIARIAEWIDLGAPFDKPLLDPADAAEDWTRRIVEDESRRYWAFQPLRQVEPPAVKNTAWPRTAIDRFILARLEKDGLALSAPAEKRTLLRRAYFDLIGMPPTPEEAREFLSDESADAYEKLIDRLLQSPHYGERWGRHWLDVSRFAESHGFEQDYDRPYAYHFRDFVIKALNADMPYDQFVRWQLAGDELAPDDPLAMMATGFLGAGVFPTQITANEVERTRYDALDDMAATMGTAMLGLTIGCARCHDHKFDPIPQSDYYRLISTFTTTVRSNIDLDLDPDGFRQAQAVFEGQHAPLAAELTKFEQEQLPDRLAEWEAKRPKELQPAWLVLDPVSAKSKGGATLKRLGDGSLLAEGENPKNDVYTFVVHTKATGITAIRLEALSHPSMKKGGPGRAANGNFALSTFRVTAAPLSGEESNKSTPVKLSRVQSTFDQKGLPASAAIDDNATSSWAVDPQFGKNHAAVFETESDVGFAEGTVLTLTLEFNNNVQHSIGRPRISITTSAGPVGLEGGAMPAAVVEILNTPKLLRTDEQTAALLTWYRSVDPEWKKINARVQASLAKAPRPKLAKVMVCSEGVKPIRHHTQGADFFEKTYFLRRGNADHKVGEAKQSFLQVLMRAPEQEKHWQVPPPAGCQTSFRRTALAGWITDRQYGAGDLLARVIVNRLWQHHFGRGIVATTNDFGRQGEPPSHPELLEWLARDLIEGGWRLKRLHKRLMTSATYRQDSAFDVSRAGIDPENRLLWRFTPRRLEAEAIRDSMLAVSGVLDRTMFGPGTLDLGHNRRSIYFTIKRSKLISVLQLFDAPEPLASVGRRPSTTIAPQALLFMNSPHVRRYTQGFAARLAAESNHPWADAVRQGYRFAVSREPSEAELNDNAAFLEQQARSYADRGQSDARSLALADFCQVLFCLNEFVYVE